MVVVARCEADMNGFSSIYEQAMTADEMQVLIAGPRQLDEPKLETEEEFRESLSAANRPVD